jgi:hypothetical protein
LNWIADLYDSVDEIRLNEQTIVYCLHEKIGHLGIFVSAGVAKRETAELASALELIDTLPPGLYEALIQDTTPDMPGLQYVEGRYLIQFAPRSIDDILALDDGRGDERAFEVAHRVSQINQQLYDRFASPLLQAMSSEPVARALRETNPARAERWLFCDRNPAMGWVKAMADAVRAQRHPVAADNPLLQAEQAASAHIEQALDQYRDARDEMAERMFKAIYESPWLAAAVGIDWQRAGRHGAGAASWEQLELQRMKRQQAEAQFEQGTPLDAWARLLLYVAREEKVVDERPYNLMQQLIKQMKPERAPTPAALKAAIKRQAFVLALDEQRAIAALPKLAPDMDERRLGYAAARHVIGTRGEPTPTRKNACAARPACSAWINRRARAIQHESRELPTPDQRRQDPAAGGHGRGPPLRRELAERGDRRRQARADHADPGRAEDQDRGGGAKLPARSVALRNRRCAAQPRLGGQGGRAGARGKRRAADEGQPAHRRAAGRGGARTPGCAPSGASATVFLMACRPIPSR